MALLENKQTAIEWAEDKLSDLNSAVINGELCPEEYHEIRVNIWKKAKEMEKEQIVKAYLEGESDGEHLNNSGENYYNEKYNKQ